MTRASTNNEYEERERSFYEFRENMMKNTLYGASGSNAIQKQVTTDPALQDTIRGMHKGLYPEYYTHKE